MKNNTKRVLSFILVLAMIVSIYCIPSFADDFTDVDVDSFIVITKDDGSDITTSPVDQDTLIKVGWRVNGNIDINSGQIAVAMNKQYLVSNPIVEGYDTYYATTKISGVTLTTNKREETVGSINYDVVSASWSNSSPKTWTIDKDFVVIPLKVVNKCSLTQIANAIKVIGVNAEEQFGAYSDKTTIKCNFSSQNVTIKNNYILKIYSCPCAVASKTAGQLYDSSTVSDIKSLLTVEEYSASGTTSSAVMANCKLYFDAACSNEITDTNRLPISSNDVTIFVKTENGNIGSVNVGTVAEDTISSITVTNLPKTDYTALEKFSSSGAVVTAKTGQGKSITLSESEYKYFLGDTELTANTDIVRANNNKDITVKLVANNSITTKFGITVKQSEVTAPTLQKIPAQYYTGQQIKPSVVFTDEGFLQVDGNYTVEYGANIEAGENVGIVTVSAVETSNYTFAAVSANFTISPTAGSIKFADASALNRTYDGTATVNPQVTTNSAGTVSYQYYEGNEDNNTKGTAISNPTDAGTYWVVATLGAVQNYAEASTEAKFTISPKTITVSGFTASSKSYDGTTNASVQNTGVKYNGVCGSDKDNLTISATGEFEDANAATNKKVVLTIGNLGGTAAKNYTLDKENSETEIKANITQTTTAISGTISITGWKFAADANAPSGLTPSIGTVVYKYSTASNGTYSETVPTLPGTYYVKGFVAETTNYTATESAFASFDITKADAPNLSATGKQVLLSSAVVGSASKDYEFNLASIITGMPATPGAVTYAIKTEGTYAKATGGGISGSTLKLNVATAQAKNTEDSVVVTVTMDNYESNDVAISFKFMDKIDASDQLTLENKTITYGDAYSLSAQTTVPNATGVTWKYFYQKSGTSSWENGTPTAVGTYTIKVEYDDTTAEGDIPGHVGTTTASLVINPKELSLTWGDTSLAYNKKEQCATISAVSGKVGDDNLGLSVEGAKTNAGTYVATASATNANYVIKESTKTTQYTIAKAKVTITGIGAENKVYDGNLAATLTYSAVKYSGKIEGDTLTVSAVGTFGDKKAADNKTVAISGIVLGGADIANYELVSTGNQTTATANITQKEVTVSGLTANDRTYDTTTGATIKFDSASITGKVEGDTLNVASAVGEFANKTVETNKTVSISGIVLGGADAANYKIASTGNQTTAKATISAVTLTVKPGTFAVTKEFNNTKAVGTSSGALTLAGVLAGDVVDITGYHVGEYPEAGYGTYSVTVSGITLTGTDAANYTVASEYTFENAKITKILPKIEDVTEKLIPVSSVYDKTAKEAVVTSSSVGIGNWSVQYRQFKDGKGQNVVNAAATSTKPVNAGQYYVEVVFASGANYEAGTVTDASWKIEITQADRNFAVSESAILVPGATTYKIAPVVDQESNLDKDVSYAYSSADNSKIYVDASGNVKALMQATEDVAITVTAQQTNNYKATSAAVKVKAYVEPITTVAAVKSGISAAVDNTNKQITLSGSVVSGNAVNIKLTAASGVTIDPTTISLTGEEVAAARTAAMVKTVTVGGVAVEYKINATALVEIPANIDIDTNVEGTTGSAAEFEGDTTSKGAIETLIETSITSKITKVEKLVEGATKEIVSKTQNFINGLVDDATKAAITEYEVKVGVKVVPIAFTATKVAVEIKPTLEIQALSGGAVVATSPAVEIAHDNLSVEAKVSVKLPTGFVPNVAKHIKHNGKVEYLPVTVVGDVASWFMGSFSEVQLLVDNPQATITYKMFDGSEQTISYGLTNCAVQLPTDGRSGYNFTGWVISGASISTSAISSMSEEVLRALDGDGKTGTAIPQFTEISYGPSTPITKTKTYDVKTTANSQCEITVDPASAEEGTKVTVSFKPQKGYEVDTVTIKTAAGSAIAATKVSDTVYEFTMPKSAVTVSVTVKEEEKVVINFVDLVDGAYYMDAVAWAVKNKVTDGVGDNKFAPTKTCSRAEVVTFLYRAAGSPEVEIKDSFDDVVKGSYYEKAVAWAIANKVTDGVGNNKFAPDMICDRAQIVTFISRFAKASGTYTNTFNDVIKGSYYENAVGWALENGITDGIGDNKFAPGRDCTRGEVVTFLYRNFNK